MCGTEVQMSKGGWARLRKQQQQQQENTLSQADGNEYQVQAQSIMQNEATLASTLPIRSVSMLQVDQGDFRASKLLQIVRRWKTQSAKQTASRSRRRSTTSSTSFSRLNFNVPLSCITFSSIQSYSDHDEEEVEDDAVDRTDSEADSRSKNAKSPAPALQLRPHRSRSAQTAEISSHQYTAKNSTQCTGKERDSFCERKVPGAACRALDSCRKLRSPLRSCTTFRSMKADGELESLKPAKLEEEAGDSLKLRRSSSSPLRRSSPSSSSLRRSSSSPLKRHSRGRQSSTPKGYLALYVGEERRRFLVKANSLNHPLFSVLLEKAREEFGFDQKGPLNIPCEIPFFQHILLLVESNDPSL